MKKIYIAGKVSGEPIEECTMKFEAVQKQVEALGFHAINPLQVVGNWEATWEQAMKKCIKSLMDCDGMVLLPDWEKSTGAKMERQLAEDLCLTICNASKEGLQVLKSNLS
jgi:hypothetical protein